MADQNFNPVKMCGVRLAFVLLLASGCNCSFLFNDTTLATLPPFNRLDDWARCQSADDVYCMVHAALTAPQPDNHLLSLLKEFSNQTLKHYNRTQVHRGLCVSRCGPRAEGSQPWHAAAGTCLNEELRQYGLGAEVLFVAQCASRTPPEPSASARAFAAVLVVLLALIVLATSVHVLGDRCANAEGNKYLMAFSLKRNWQILTYDRRQPRSDQRMKDLTAIEGIRVVGVVMVIVSHVIMWNVVAFTANPEYFEKLYDTSMWLIMMNMPVWLQAFFCMSAFLTTYSVLITVDKSPITLWKCFLSVVNRYMRLTPPAAACLWFVLTWWERFGEGPQWALSTAREADHCSRRWWYHLIYVQNHLPTGEMCMAQTWYLAADIQLHIIGLLVLWVMMKCRRAVTPLLLIMGVGSALAAGLVAYFYKLKPIATGQAPETLRTLFLDSDVLVKLYTPSWMNLAGYACGMATAFVYHYTQTAGIKLNQQTWFNVLFHLSLVLASGVVSVGIVFARDDFPPQWVSSIYAGLDRPLVSVFFNIFLLGCFTKCKSAFRSILEWRGFHVMGRLSYGVFLVHYIVLVVTTAANTQLLHVSVRALITQIISTAVISFIVAIPFCLIFELPPLQLWKALTEGDRGDRARPAEVATPPPEPVKPLDLVANIRRRQDV